MFAVSLLAAGTGQAQEFDNGGISLATVSAADDSPSEGAAVLVGQISRQSYKRNPRYSVLELGDVLRGNGQWPAKRRLRQAEEALANAQAGYDAFELEPTLEALAEAVIGFEQALAAMEDMTPLVAAYKLQGATYALKGDTKNAAAAFARVFLLDPDATLGDDGFPDTVQSIFEEERARLSEQKTGALSVYSAPNAAEVWLDGSFVGVTPLNLDTLPIGRHYLRVAKDGYEAYGAAVDVARGKERNVQATLRAEKRFSEFDDLLARLAQGSEQGAAELARMLKVDQLFWTQVKANGDQLSVTGTLLDGVSGEVVLTQQKTFQQTSPRFRAEVEQWISQNFRKSLVSDTTSHTTQQDTGDSLIPEEKVAPPTPLAVVAGWTFIGVSAVGFVVGAGSGIWWLTEWDYYRNQGDWFYSGQGIPHQQHNNVPNSQDRLVTSGIISDVGWAVGIGLATTGGILLAIGLNQQQEIEDVLAADANSPTTERSSVAQASFIEPLVE